MCLWMCMCTPVYVCTPVWLTRPADWKPPVSLGWPWLLNWTTQRERRPRNQTSELLWWPPQAAQSRQTSPPGERTNCVKDSNWGDNDREEETAKAVMLLSLICSVCFCSQKVIRGVVCFYNWTTYKLIWKSFLDFGKEEGLALADWMSLEKNSAISCTLESYLVFRLKSGTLVQNTPEGHKNDLTHPNFTAQKTQSNSSVCKSTHRHMLHT